MGVGSSATGPIQVNLSAVLEGFGQVCGEGVEVGDAGGHDLMGLPGGPDAVDGVQPEGAAEGVCCGQESSCRTGRRGGAIAPGAEWTKTTVGIAAASAAASTPSIRQSTTSRSGRSRVRTSATSAWMVGAGPHPVGEQAHDCARGRRGASPGLSGSSG